MWQKQEVRDNRSGITDIIKNSPPTFQEECTNLIHDNKEGNLEQRAGSEYWTTFDAPATIRQIFQLEDYIFAYCYDDPGTPGDDIDGRVYWVLEDGTSVAWTEVATQGTDTTFKIRLRDTKNKGLDIEIPEGDTYFVEFFKTKFSSAAQDYPEILHLGGTTPQIRISVLETRLNVQGYYVRGDTGFEYDYEDMKTEIEGASFGSGWTVSYSPLTDAADFVHFSASFAPDGESFETGIGETTGRYIATFLPVFTKEGHVQISPWADHLFLSLEPFDKTFVPNDDDPYAEFPDSFPPENDREPLRKLYLVNEDNVISPILCNAQLPEMKISFEEDSTSTLTDSDSKYRFIRQEFPIENTTGIDAEVIGSVIFWSERAIGPAPGNNITPLDIFATNAADYIEDKVDNAAIAWGRLAINIQSGSGIPNDFNITVGDFITRVTNLIDVKSSANVYGSSFNYTLVATGIDSSTVFAALATSITTLHTNIDPDEVSLSTYAYGSFLRDSYQANVDGEPRLFTNDGPATLVSFPVFREITNSSTFIYNSSGGTKYFFSRYPTIWVGLSKLYDADYSLYIQDHLEGEVARTTENGDTIYIAYRVKRWIPIASSGLPDNIKYEQNWDRDIDYVFEYEDRVDDDQIVGEEPAYFNGNVASHDSLPQGGSYYFTVVNQTGYHANIIGNVARVYESPPGVPYAAPGLFFEDFEDGVTGISHFSNKPIIFTPNTTWRWEGTNGSTGDGRTFIRVVSDEFGTIANQSIVRTNRGLFYWSKTGIVFTDGLKALRVTEHLIERYALWLSYLQTSSEEIGPKYLRGTYDEINRRVLWSSLDIDGNPVTIVLDVFEGVSDKMPVFMEMGNTNVKWNGAEYETTNMVQTSGLFFSEDNNSVYRAQDTRILKASQTATFDQYWDGTQTFNIPIRPYLKSIAFDYGSRSDRKWTTSILYGFEDLAKTGVSLQPLGWNDLSQISHDLYPMVNYQHVEWSADYAETPQVTLEQFFLHTDVSFKSDHIVSYNRKFPRNKIRNTYKQIGFEELPITLGDLSEGSGNVTHIDVSYVSGTGRNLVELDVGVSDTGDNALIDLGLDASGSFYATWDNQDERVKIHSFDLVGFVYTMQVYTSDESTNDYTYTDAWPLTIYRVFSDQKIKLSDYSLKFKSMGDKTQGLVRPTEQGGFNG